MIFRNNDSRLQLGYTTDADLAGCLDTGLQFMLCVGV
jgi:hypothetical protein